MLGYYNYTVILTYIGMIVGFKGISCAMMGNYHRAILYLIIAGICDMFDGKIASTRKRDQNEKNFGIQIDSLSDLICFGVLPAILVYCINDHSLHSFCASALYALCALIRLAYFNVDEGNRQSQTTEGRKIYQGLPVTISALILPGLYEISCLLDLPTALITFLSTIGMAIAFLSPFHLSKPHGIGKVLMGLCTMIELILIIVLLVR